MISNKNKKYLKLSSMDERGWAGEAPLPDTRGLNSLQAAQLEQLTSSADATLRAQMDELAGLPMTETAYEEMIKKLQAGIVQELDTQTFNTFNKPAPTIASNDAFQGSVLRSVDPKLLLNRVFEVCEYEDILVMLMRQLEREPTNNAVLRTLEFINSTTHPSRDFSTFDSEGFDTVASNISKRDKRLQSQKEIDFLLEQLNELIFVSKARLIMNEYPESISISVQMSPSIGEDEAEMAMQAFEDLLRDYKPNGLNELEVSITNKVVY